jgi:glutathione S-transferase
MSINPFVAPETDGFTLRESLEWHDPDIDCALVVSTPKADRVLWADYSAGALSNYRKHGVECALDTEALRSGSDTTMFFAVVNQSGRTVAGLRAIGPLRSAEDSHALVEWAGQASQQQVRHMIDSRAPFGILEMKSAWATDDPENSHRITDAMARSAFHMMTLLGNQFCMATAAAYALNRWRSSGGVISAIPATPYPSERYQTKMMWWDRHDFVNHAKPEQVSKILNEMRMLARRCERPSEFLSTAK